MKRLVPGCLRRLLPETAYEEPSGDPCTPGRLAHRGLAALVFAAGLACPSDAVSQVRTTPGADAFTRDLDEISRKAWLREAAAIRAAATVGASAQEVGDETLDVLFVGNSYTYYNNLPAVVEGLAAGAREGPEVRAGRVTVGGATLSALWRAGEAVDSIRTGRFDRVVLQEQSLLGGIRVNGEPVLGTPDSLLAAARRFRDEARRHGAEAVLLLTWARESAPEQQAGLDHAYLSVGKELGLRVIPAGRVWARLRAARPETALHGPDGSHPSPAGTYVAASTVLGTLLGDDAVRDLPPAVSTDSLDARGERVAGRASHPRFPAAFVSEVRDAVRQELAAFRAAGGYPETRAPGPVALPRVPQTVLPSDGVMEGRWIGPLAMNVAGSLRLDVESIEGDEVEGRVRATLGSSVYEAPADDVRLVDGVLVGELPLGMGALGFRLAYRGDTLAGTAELTMGRPIAVSAATLEPAGACEAMDPSWSPDGSWLVFVSTCDGNMDLYRARPDGSDVSRLTRTPGAEHGPAWSSDGSRLAYAYAREGAHSEIMTMAADGSGAQPVTANETTEWGPTWSPDGSRLAFESHRDGNADVFVVDLTSGEETRLTTDPARDLAPSWSPDGSQIAFQTNRDGRYAIYGVDPAGGSPPRPLVALAGDAVIPDWSPDGGRLVFAFQPEGKESPEIWTTERGGGSAPLTADDRIDFAPAWSPDGSRIAFMARLPGDGWSVWTVRADGAEERRVRPTP